MITRNWHLAGGAGVVLTVMAALGLAGAATAQQKLPAILAGHAALPASTFTPAPADAPPGLSLSGKFTAADGARNDRPGSMPASSFLSDGRAPRPTGLSLPFQGQPVQGFSALKKAGDGSYWTIQDNGFGTRANSLDALLSIHRVQPDWTSGLVRVLETIFLSDPNRILPFHIVTDPSPTRYLTGGDLDPESLQVIGDGFWIGDEHGPYLVRADRQGRITHFTELRHGGRVLRSPDHYRLALPAAPGPVNFELRRSRGFEGLGISPDGKKLYAMLEGAFYDPPRRQWENRNGLESVRIFEYDETRRDWTGRSFRYQLEANENSVTELALIDATTALVIERDNKEGDPAEACPPQQIATTCYNSPAQFKRIYKIDFAQLDIDGFVRKIAYIDLLDITIPDGKTRGGTGTGKFAVPLVTPEGLDIIDADHVVLINDNNLPFSQGRTFGRNDDTEFVLLKVSELLRAK